MRSPIRRPALPRASSAMSGFFFCGSIERAGGVGVVEAWRSRTRRSTTARPPRRCATGGRRAARGRTAPRPRSRGRDTASRLFSNRRREAEVVGHAVGVERERRAGQRAGAERRDVGAPAAVEQPVDVAGQRPAVGEQVVGQQHRLGPLQVRVARAGRRRRPRRPGRAAPPAARGRARRRRAAPASCSSRRSVATWSLRLRPVWSLAPAGPASSVTRRSTAVWMSSSDGTNANVPVGQLRLDLVEGGEHGVALVVGEDAGPHQARGRGRASPAMSSARQALVEAAGSR